MSDRLFNKLVRYDVISFDIFDTLIERDTVLPSEIFSYAAETVIPGRAEEFRTERIKAEEEARTHAENGEVTLEEIYDYLNSSYKAYAEQLCQAEVQQELQHCYPKKEITEVYKKLLENGKKIYLISDMYLSSKVIGQMLENCGITGYARICVSNEYHCNKRNGQLFQRVIKEDSLNKKKMIHVGDSIRADCIGPWKAGIRSVLISRKNRLKRVGHH